MKQFSKFTSSRIKLSEYNHKFYDLTIAYYRTNKNISHHLLMNFNCARNARYFYGFSFDISKRILFSFFLCRFNCQVLKSIRLVIHFRFTEHINRKSEIGFRTAQLRNFHVTGTLFFLLSIREIFCAHLLSLLSLLSVVFSRNSNLVDTTIAIPINFPSK